MEVGDAFCTTFQKFAVKFFERYYGTSYRQPVDCAPSSKHGVGSLPVALDYYPP